MPRSVILSHAALRDLEQIKRWLLQPGSGRVARRKLQKIRAAIRHLAEAPFQWPIGDHSDVHEVPIEGYRVVYEIDPGTAGFVRILRVFGPYMSRDQL